MPRRGGEYGTDGRRAPAGEDDVAAVAAMLSGAAFARSDPDKSEAAVMQALAVAPDSFEARLAAYRFYFYNHRLDETLPHAADIVERMARRLNVATDWRLVRRDDAVFSAPDEAPGLYLQALLAWGYASVRLGRIDEGSRALQKVVELDPGDRFGAGRLLAVIAAASEPDEA